MKRRAFITSLGCAAVAWPLAAHAQQSARPTIGFLGAASQNQVGDYWDAFQKGLEEGGFIDGRNVTIESRWAEGHYERLPDLAADLVRRHVAVLIGAASVRFALFASSTTDRQPPIGWEPVGGDSVRYRRPDRP
jgi:putative ABC transport system substrate-binding protein